MALRMSVEEFAAFCASRNIRASVQAGRRQGGVFAQGTDKKRPPKYRNRKVYLYDTGLTSASKDPRLGTLLAVYDSEKEFDRHHELKFLEKQGLVSKLQRQVPLLIQEPCERHGERINGITYVADFCYCENGEDVVEDVKGFDENTQKFILTKDFKLKWKLFQYKYPDRFFRIY